MRNIFVLTILILTAINSKAIDQRVLFKAEATDKRKNVAEPTIIFLKANDKVVFESSNVALDKIVILKINTLGELSEVDGDVYRELVDKSHLIVQDGYVYFYYSKQFYTSGAFGISIVGSFYEKQAEALGKIEYNQNFKEGIANILSKIIPVDRVYPEEPLPASGTSTTE